jgi:hypothetical protein
MAEKIHPNDLVGAHEIAERLGVAFPQMVHEWRRRHNDFPQPIAQLLMGMIWDWKDIEVWARKTKRMK